MRSLVWMMTLLCAGSALAEEKSKVAVLDIQATGVEKELVPTLTEILTVEVDSIGKYKVIAGRDIQSMLGFEKEKDIVGCTDASCLAEIGGALGVDRIIASHIGKVGSTYVVNIKLINIRMADTENRVYETVRGEVDALIETIRKSAHKLLAAAGTTDSRAASVAKTPEAEPRIVKPTLAPAPMQSAPGPVESTPAVEAKVSRGRIGWLPITLWSVGGVAGAFGVFQGIRAKSLEGDANRTLNNTGGVTTYEVGAQRAAQDAPKAAGMATAGLAVGVLSIGGGFVAHWLSGKDEPATTAWVPMLATDGVGLAWQGQF